MVGVAPHFEVFSLRMMLFLVPTFFLVFSICALYDNVRSSVTPRYTGRLQWVKFIQFQLMFSCLPHSRFWRQARVVALLKPGKDPSSPKSFRPISLLCHLYKLYERLILNRLSPVIENVLIPEQAGFRPGKSCTAQVLNLTQHIEDGFETGKITGIVLVDLSAAYDYDTVNHRRLLEKVYNMTRDYRLMCMIRTLLENRRFFVELGGKRSRWRSQRNGLPQGSVLAPLLFNIYTNDQPIHPDTRSFVYADDLAVTTQSTDFAPIEETLTSALEVLSEYYTTWGDEVEELVTHNCADRIDNSLRNWG